LVEEYAFKINGTVIAIRQETPTVKVFILDLRGQSLDFKPGQYVDVLFGPPEHHYAGGGYSITSSPNLKGTVHLAVKQVDDKGDSAALHARAKVGDPALVMGPGGDFYYVPGSAKSLVLIAGGIGITPLMSVINYVIESEPQVTIDLLYSAKTPDELAFHRELEALAKRHPPFRPLFTITQPQGKSWPGRTGRIDSSLLAPYAAKSGADFYLCGPPGMPEALAGILEDLGVDSDRINSESW